jgi:hypothetical protein
VDRPGAVADDEVLDPSPVEEAGDADAGDAGAADDHPDARQLLADDAQRVVQRGQDEDRGAVVLVGEDGDVGRPLQVVLDGEGGRGADVVDADGAEGGGHREAGADDVSGVVGIEAERGRRRPRRRS